MVFPKIIRLLLLVTSIVLLVPELAQSDEQLPRRAYLGVQVAALSDAQQQQSDYGLSILSVFPDSTAAAYGFEPGQIILQANQTLLRTPADLPEILAGFASGAEVEFLLLENGEQRRLNATLRGFPAEQYSNATVQYGGVESSVGRQRTILTVPADQESPPVVYVLQGFDCSSVDMALNSSNSMGMLIERLNAAGYAEKSDLVWEG